VSAWRARLADHVDISGCGGVQGGQHVTHEDDGGVAVQHVDAGGNQRSDGEHALGSHLLHMPLQALPHGAWRVHTL
jgi:hypothetical protein